MKVVHKVTGRVLHRISGTRHGTPVFNDRNLTNAMFAGADLCGAVFRGCTLSHADFTTSDLRGARFVNCVGSDILFNAADMRASVICSQKTAEQKHGVFALGFQRCTLIGADLRGADLTCARIRNSVFDKSRMTGTRVGADKVIDRFGLSTFNGASSLPVLIKEAVPTLPRGEIRGWKRCSNDRILELLIPADAQRSAGLSNKLRASHVLTTNIRTIAGRVCHKAVSGLWNYDESSKYRVGQITRADRWDPNPWKVCTNGIHFFLTRAEAVAFFV